MRAAVVHRIREGWLSLPASLRLLIVLLDKGHDGWWHCLRIRDLGLGTPRKQDQSPVMATRGHSLFSSFRFCVCLAFSVILGGGWTWIRLHRSVWRVRRDSGCGTCSSGPGTSAGPRVWASREVLSPQTCVLAGGHGAAREGLGFRGGPRRPQTQLQSSGCIVSWGTSESRCPFFLVLRPLDAAVVGDV